jgi:S-adenosylmethionine:tRNA ribosyltransferase-isomerase
MLEHWKRSSPKLRAIAGQTDLFIYPPFDFKLVKGLLTNFHLPRSSLFALVCAFLGTELARQCYRHAVERHYRFYSYGDCMLIV